jgi:endo-1,4-beta-xylanase
MRRSHWLALVVAALCLAACGGGPAARPARTTLAAPALRAAASARGALVGSALAASHLAADPAYAKVAGSQFNSVTPENEMKWESVEPRRGQFDWSGADAIVTFAEAHGQRIRGHNLVWHQQLPSWLTGGSFLPGRAPPTAA